MTGHLKSSGRGGAGNIVDSSKSPRIQPEDLQTPTLKSTMVTTGRGGTGNMAKNSDPVETRRRQDVEPVVRRDSFGATHIGRGGTGNVFTAEDAQAAREAQKQHKAADKEDENHLHLHNLLHPSRTHSGHRENNNNNNNNKENNNKENNNKTVPLERPGAHEKGKRSESDMGWAEKSKNFLFGKKDLSNNNNNNGGGDKKEDNKKRDRSAERKSGGCGSS